MLYEVITIPGNTIMAIDTLDRLHRYQTPGSIDFPRLLAGKKIYCAAWIQSGSATEPVYFKKNQHILSEQWRKAVRTSYSIHYTKLYDRRTKFILDCDALLKADAVYSQGFQAVHGRLQVSLQDRPPAFLIPGNTIMAIATLDRLHRYQTRNNFV